MQHVGFNQNIKQNSHTGLPHDMLFVKCSFKKKKNEEESHFLK